MFFDRRFSFFSSLKPGLYLNTRALIDRRSSYWLFLRSALFTADAHLSSAVIDGCSGDAKETGWPWRKQNKPTLSFGRRCKLFYDSHAARANSPRFVFLFFVVLSTRLQEIVDSARCACIAAHASRHLKKSLLCKFDAMAFAYIPGEPFVQYGRSRRGDSPSQGVKAPLGKRRERQSVNFIRGG